MCHSSKGIFPSRILGTTVGHDYLDNCNRIVFSNDDYRIHFRKPGNIRFMGVYPGITTVIPMLVYDATIEIVEASHVQSMV